MYKNEYSCSNVEKKKKKKTKGKNHAWNYPCPSRDLELKTLMYFLSTFRVSIHPDKWRGEEKRREEKRREEEIGWTAQFLSRLQQSLEWKPRRSPLERSKASWGNVTFSINHLDITILQESVDVTRTRDKLLSSYATLENTCLSKSYKIPASCGGVIYYSAEARFTSTGIDINRNKSSSHVRRFEHRSASLGLIKDSSPLRADSLPSKKTFPLRPFPPSFSTRQRRILFPLFRPPYLASRFD